MRRTRGITIIEFLAACTLFLVLLSAIFPRLDTELGHLGELYEREAARLLVEGELARAEEAALAGKLAPGTERLATDGYASAERLPELSLVRTLTRGSALEITVRAEWRSRQASPGAPRRSVALTTWARTP